MKADGTIFNSVAEVSICIFALQELESSAAGQEKSVCGIAFEDVLHRNCFRSMFSESNALGVCLVRVML